MLADTRKIREGHNRREDDARHPADDEAEEFFEREHRRMKKNIDQH